MARKHISPEVVIIDPIIRLQQGKEVIFEEDFSSHLMDMDAHQRQHWLTERAGLLMDEYQDGAFDTNGELDPWEPNSPT